MRLRRMRIKISSEDGTWTILQCDTVITDHMTGTELLRYVWEFVEKYCPERGDHRRLRTMLEVLE